MADKRFTDTEKWDDPWFQDLPSKYQKFWIYICDKCDRAGIWKVNKPLADFQLRENIEIEEAIFLFNQGKNRVRFLGEGKWFIEGFIQFQYTHLKRYDKNGNINRVHAPIYASLESNGLDCSFYEIDENRGSTETLQSLLARQEQDKNKTRQEKEGGSRGGFKKPSLEDLAEALGAGGLDAATALAEAKAFLDYYESVGWVVGRTRKPMKNWRGAVSTWIKNRREWGQEGRERPNPMNFNKKQLANMGALNEFLERKGAVRSEDLCKGDGDALKRIPGS